MGPQDETYTVAMPWYEESEFPQLWALAHDRDQMPKHYSVWLNHATKALHEMLSSGRAVEVITVRLAPYCAWLAERSLESTATNRRRYVEELATRGGETRQGGAPMLSDSIAAKRDD